MRTPVELPCRCHAHSRCLSESIRLQKLVPALRYIERAPGSTSGNFGLAHCKLTPRSR